MVVLWLAAALVPASAKDWNAQRVPAPGPAQAIGGTSAGCLQGAATLPASGPGYEVLHLGRDRRYGHPELIAFVRRLGAAAKANKLGLMVVGDLSQPRGGPTPNGHRSHQTGLDVDVGYAAPAGLRAGHVTAAERERLRAPAAVDLRTHAATAVWTSKTVSVARDRRCRSGRRSDLRQPGHQADAVSGTKRQGALDGAHSPLVGTPRPFPRPSQMPGRKPSLYHPRSAPRRRLRRLAGLVVQLRCAGRAGETQGSGPGAARSGGVQRSARASRQTSRPGEAPWRAQKVSAAPANASWRLGS